MDKAVLEKILKTELDYSSFEASVTANDLLRLHPKLKAAAEQWAQDRVETDLVIHGFRAGELMERKGFTYPAALIALDWLLTDPEIAAKELSRNILRK